MEKTNSADPDTGENVQKVNSPLVTKLRRCASYITVEPLLACYILPSVLASIAVQNLNLEKACRVNKNYGDAICTDLIEQRTANKTDEEIEVQTLVAHMTSWRLPLQTAIPALTILFVGAWSDRYRKRKSCMLVPMLGELLTAVGLILCTYYFLQWPLEVAGLIEALPPALTGGWACMFMAVFSYLADHTTPEDRTFRIGIVNVIISIAVPVGTALSGVMLNELGFYGVFSVCVLIYVAGFVYGYARIEDVKVDEDARPHTTGCCVHFFDWRLVRETFMVMFRSRPGKRRARTILLMVCYIVVSGPVHGTGQLIYLYARRRYSFNEVDFSIFSSYSIVMNLIGVMIAITLFSKIMKIDDTIIGAIACFSKFAASFVYTFAPTKTWFYLGPAVELLGGAGVIAMRSIATKVVDFDETGKINSIFGVCDAIVNVIYAPIFAEFYVQTIGIYPGLFCLLAGILVLPSVGIFLYMNHLQKIDKALEKEHQVKEGIDNDMYDVEITAL